MDIVPFQVEHLKRIILQPSQRGCLDSIQTYEAYASATDYAFTAIDGDVVVACAGIFEFWEGRGQAWALMSADIGSRFLKIHRAVNRAIDLSGYNRIEMDVDAEFVQGLKWAEMLGFICETPNGRQAYGPDGRNYKLYARVR